MHLSAHATPEPKFRGIKNSQTIMSAEHEWMKCNFVKNVCGILGDCCQFSLCKSDLNSASKWTAITRVPICICHPSSLYVHDLHCFGGFCCALILVQAWCVLPVNCHHACLSVWRAKLGWMSAGTSCRRACATSAAATSTCEWVVLV